METLLKMLLTRIMYEDCGITKIGSLKDLYKVSYSGELLGILEGAWKENIPVSVVISAANAAYKEVRKNA